MNAGILNGGKGSWAFSQLAAQLQQALWLEAVDEAADLNYVLFYDGDKEPTSFIPLASVEIASDKRVQAELFTAAGVPMPKTILLPNAEEVYGFVSENADRGWVLKYPIGCGAAGHRMLGPETQIRDDWPTPFIVQEFVEMDDPVVYRVYVAGGRLFGFNERRFGDPEARRSPSSPMPPARRTVSSMTCRTRPPAPPALRSRRPGSTPRSAAPTSSAPAMSGSSSRSAPTGSTTTTTAKYPNPSRPSLTGRLLEPSGSASANNRRGVRPGTGGQRREQPPQRRDRRRRATPSPFRGDASSPSDASGRHRR